MISQTISAIATAPGEGGIGIIRLSGDQALSIAVSLFKGQPQQAADFKSHRAYYGQICDPKTHDVIDEAIVLYMKAPHSYTCEDVVEIQCHGGMKPLENILALTLREGARLAEPGEFTKRAFLNGRLDLTQAQAVIDVIRAKTDASLKMAVGHLGGEFSGRIKEFRHVILGLIAHLEAAIDFPEDDIDDIVIDDVKRKVSDIQMQLSELLATAKTGRVLRDGLETAIIGRPNVGKSSLLNALLQAKRAIVTEIPGTTRDVIEEYANIGGVPLRIIDTAGIRHTDDVVEKIGVEKSRDYIERADLILLLLDAAAALNEEDREILKLIRTKKAIVLVNKCDLTPKLCLDEVQQLLDGQPLIHISAKQGAGLDDLAAMIHDMVYEGVVSQGEGAFVSNVRQAELLRQALCKLEEVVKTIELDMAADFVVIDLRAVWEKLGEITGETVGDDIIDQIFSQFCIGK